MDALDIESAIVAGFDWGARSANVVAALWPERCKALVSVSGYLIGNPAANTTPLPPPAELSWWYQFYFATERGRIGYDKYRHDFAKLIWHTASPEWNFDDDDVRPDARRPSTTPTTSTSSSTTTGGGSAWRQASPNTTISSSNSPLAPVITVPTITLEGDANGAPHPDPSAYATKFSGQYTHRTIAGGSRTQPAPRSA